MTEQQVADETSLLPAVIAETVIARRQPKLTASQQEWFIAHAIKRTVLCYARNLTFRRQLRRDEGREYLYMFVGHWLDAMLKDPDTYQKRHHEDQ